VNLQRAIVASILAVLVTFVAMAGTASAATQVGQKCQVGYSGQPTMIQASVTSGESYTVASSGILTSWGVDTTIFGSSSMLAAVFGTESGGIWTVHRATPFQLVVGNRINAFSTRMPVVAGEVLGMVSYNSNNLMCGVLPIGDSIASSGASTYAGESFMPNAMPQFRVGVWGIVEPDVDGDGFGDDTQDKCPQSAAFQNACPVLAINQQLAAVKGAISGTATASVDSLLTARASVKVPKLGSKKAATVTFSSKPTAFKAGQFTKFKLRLPARVKSALAGMKKSKKLKVTVTLSGNGIANTATSIKSISLPGTKKK
jgi:hypothetical protein